MGQVRKDHRNKRKNLRIEAVQIKLTGELAKYYSVEYKASISSLGDSQGWVQNGAIAGTRKNSKRIEVLQIRLVPVGKNTSSSVIYRLRGQTYGWQRRWSMDGQASGTSSKRGHVTAGSRRSRSSCAEKKRVSQETLKGLPVPNLTLITLHPIPMR